MVHLSDLDWNRPGEQVIDEYNRGDIVKAQVSTSTSTRSVSRSASSRLAAIRSAKRRFRRAAQERCRHLRSHRL
jgi:ribosomal protein S1